MKRTARVQLQFAHSEHFADVEGADAEAASRHKVLYVT